MLGFYVLITLKVISGRSDSTAISRNGVLILLALEASIKGFSVGVLCPDNIEGNLRKEC